MNYRTRKWRNEIRTRYIAETGQDDWAAPEFEAWLKAQGVLPKDG